MLKLLSERKQSTISFIFLRKSNDITANCTLQMNKFFYTKIVCNKNH